MANSSFSTDSERIAPPKKGRPYTYKCGGVARQRPGGKPSNRGTTGGSGCRGASVIGATRQQRANTPAISTQWKGETISPFQKLPSASPSSSTDLNGRRRRSRAAQGQTSILSREQIICHLQILPSVSPSSSTSHLGAAGVPRREAVPGDEEGSWGGSPKCWSIKFPKWGLENG